MANNISRLAEQYFNRFQDLSVPIKCSQKFNAIIVIPSYKEPELLKTLQSLAFCNTPKKAFLVLIFINASESCNESIKQFNKNTYQEVEKFIDGNSFNNLSFYCFLDNNLPKKQAGVGYARKVLMDTALKKFALQKTDGIIINTDADCLFSPNYLQCIERHFEDNTIQLAVVHYEHRIAETENKLLAKAITEYELHLRYYKQALEWTGYPNVLETIGSCMVCTGSCYAKEGGMNKRKAGEDFYFINKLVKNNSYTTITDTKVMPSCRTSDRVAFGTGKAMNEYIEQAKKVLLSYDFRCFVALKQFVNYIDLLYHSDIEHLDLDQSIYSFFSAIKINENINRIRKQAKSIAAFRVHFFSWFDHLKALQFIHFYTENKYKKIPINQAAKALLEQLEEISNTQTTFELLVHFRTNEISKYES